MSLNTYVNSISLGNTLNSNAKLNVNGSTNILSNSYISFGTNFESTSYGLRDNNGIIEFKNNNGSWLPVLALNNIVDNTLSGNKIIDNTININKLNGGGTGLNVILDNNTVGKVSNNVINDNTISGVKITNNTINPTKISGYPTDGTKYLSGDGTWKVSGGTSKYLKLVNQTDFILAVDLTLPHTLFLYYMTTGSGYGSYLTIVLHIFPLNNANITIRMLFGYDRLYSTNIPNNTSVAMVDINNSTGYYGSSPITSIGVVSNQLKIVPSSSTYYLYCQEM